MKGGVVVEQKGNWLKEEEKESVVKLCLGK